MAVDIDELVASFVRVAHLARVRLYPTDVEREYLRAPDGRSARWREGRQAVYAFFVGDVCLKVGKAGPHSAARFTSQHYGTRERSTLAKSLLREGRRLERHLPPTESANVRALTEESVGAWVEMKTDRLNLFLPALLPDGTGPHALSLLEAFMQCRLRPVFEGGSGHEPAQPAGEMFTANAKPGESPDLGMWKDVLDPAEMAELERLSADTRRAPTETPAGERRSAVRVSWVTWDEKPREGLGHGVGFYDTRIDGQEASLVAFLEGFEWLHGEPEEVVIHSIRPNAVTTPRVLEAMRKRVEELLARRELPHGLITRRIMAVVNG